MRLALFSDIHGNLAALEAILSALREHGPFDARVCAGDAVFLGPSPGEVLDRLQAEEIELVRGNADDFVTGLRPPERPPDPRVADLLEQHVTWNRERLRAEQLEWLRSLPLTRRYGSLCVCHATPESNSESYPQVHLHSEAELRRVYGSAGAEAVCFGHYHRPGVTALQGLTLVNISSVSIPFDGQPLAGFTVAEYLQGFWRFEQHRVPYDLAPEIERMRQRAMPEPPWPKLPA
ncbi:MAG: metallophosphoesterase family protein [Bacillota bacterium]